MYESESNSSVIRHVDENFNKLSDVTIARDDGLHAQAHKIFSPNIPKRGQLNKKQDKISIAHNLPTVASYNLRSFLPKKESLITDILERSIDCGFLQEIWEAEDNKDFQLEIEKC